MTPERALEERRLFTRWHEHGDPRDREVLVQRFLPLARSLAARYRASDEPLEDLVQVACVGLLNAIDRFDPSRGAAFSSFAVPTILGELRRHFRDRTWALRVPRERQELYLRIERARDELTGPLGREPTLAELGQRLDATEEQILQALELNAVFRAVPLEVEGEDEDGRAMPGTLDPEFDRADDRAVLAALMPALGPLETEVVRLRFAEDLTQEEIGRRVGVSQMHVSRVLHRSLARLRAVA